MAWKKRRKKQWAKPPTDPVEKLSQLTPQKLRQKLRELDQTIAETEPNLAASHAATERARPLHSILDERWRVVVGEFIEQSREIRADVDEFSEQAHRRWQTDTPFFRRLFADDNRLRLAKELNSWLVVNTQFPLDAPLKERPVSPICSWDQYLSLRHRLIPKLQKRRDLVTDAFHAILCVVESSEAMGSQMPDWENWKLSMSICVGDLPGYYVGERLRFHPQLFEGRFPGLYGVPKDQTESRRFYEAVVAQVQSQKELIERALVKLAQEANDLREKHGFDDKTIAAAASFWQQTRDLADRLRREMLEELCHQSLCPYCTGPLGDPPHLDHIHPCSHGGFSKRDNLVFVCSTCNLKKGDRTLLEFADYTTVDFPTLVKRLRAIGKRV